MSVFVLQVVRCWSFSTQRKLEPLEINRLMVSLYNSSTAEPEHIKPSPKEGIDCASYCRASGTAVLKRSSLNQQKKKKNNKVLARNSWERPAYISGTIEKRDAKNCCSTSAIKHATVPCATLGRIVPLRDQQSIIINPLVFVFFFFSFRAALFFFSQKTLKVLQQQSIIFISHWGL